MPTIVHFSVALLLCAVLRAPWHAVADAAILWGVVGMGGLAYTAIVMRRIRRQSGYSPEMEDWLFHVVVPMSA